MASPATEKMASAPHSGLSVARHLGCSPPPHSSVNNSLVPSLLNVAECQNAKFESATAAIRRGWTGSRMSSSKPYPAHRSEEHTSELQSRENLVCRLLLEKKKQRKNSRRAT